MVRAFHQVPLIDISSLRSGDPARRTATAEAMGKAAREVGFLYVSGHGVDPALITGVLDQAKTFFAQAHEAKMAAYIGRSVNHSGYVPEGEEVFASGKIDKKEAYDVNLDYRGEGRAPMLGPTLWPDVPGFRDAALAYYRAMAGLADTLFAGFALALGMPETYFTPFRRDPPSQLRIIHYPFDPDGPPDQQGIGAHTDYECFTILHGDAPGLEVLNGEGQWIDAPPIPGAFVVNIGDMLEAWTNGEFLATSHRVRKVGEARYALPFFATCDYYTVVEPLPRFVTDGRPAAYPRIVSGEHLFAQTAQTFAYLKRRRAAGELDLPGEALALLSFGQAVTSRA